MGPPEQYGPTFSPHRDPATIFFDNTFVFVIIKPKEDTHAADPCPGLAETFLKAAHLLQENSHADV